MMPHLKDDHSLELLWSFHFEISREQRNVVVMAHLKDDRSECGSVKLSIVVEHTLTKLGSEKRFQIKI